MFQRIRGEEPLQADTRYTGVARDLRAHIDAPINAAPENWSTLFAMLKS